MYPCESELPHRLGDGERAGLPEPVGSPPEERRLDSERHEHRLAEGGGGPERREGKVDDLRGLPEAPGDRGDQLVQRHVAIVADQVRLADRLRMLRRQLECVDQVVDVAGVIEGLAVPEHEEPAALDRAIEHEEPARVSGAVDPHRADHRGLEPPSSDLPERELPLVLGLLVVVLGSDRRALVAGRPGDVPVNALRRAVHEPPHLVAEARLGHVARALAVDLPVLALGQVDLPEGGGEVEDDVGPGDEPVDEGGVGHAPQRDLRAELPELVVEEPGGRVEDPYLIPPREETPDEVATGEAGAAGDKRAHGPSIAGARRQAP
jgi:hypothetical protein